MSYVLVVSDDGVLKLPEGFHRGLSSFRDRPNSTRPANHGRFLITLENGARVTGILLKFASVLKRKIQ